MGGGGGGGAHDQQSPLLTSFSSHNDDDESTQVSLTRTGKLTPTHCLSSSVCVCYIYIDRVSDELPFYSFFC